MAKSKTRKFWITIPVVTLIISGLLFFPQENSVRALFGNEHGIEVLVRFWNEIASKSEAGRYYQGLVYKHSNELMQIFRDHPQHIETEFLQTIQIFTPGLEALVDGKGDTVQITEEQISSLKAELDWIHSFASPSLREDIEKERQRFPLDNFVGITMSAALDYVNSNWVPGTQGIPICLIGPDPDCQEKPTLVLDSNGLWASYILNGVYFEYPSNWEIQQWGNHNQQDKLFIMPVSNSPEAGYIYRLDMFAGDMSIGNKDEYELYGFPEGLINLPSTLAWKQAIPSTNFQAIEYLNDAEIALNVLFYNQRTELGVFLYISIKYSQMEKLATSSHTIAENLPNIQHIIESIRIWNP